MEREKRGAEENACSNCCLCDMPWGPLVPYVCPDPNVAHLSLHKNLEAKHILRGGCMSFSFAFEKNCRACGSLPVILLSLNRMPCHAMTNHIHHLPIT